MKKKYGIVALLVFSAGQMAVAGDCVLTISRTACPGKQAEALKPYGGKETTEEKKSADDGAACAKAAEKAAKIVRKGVLSAKKVTATFGGAPVEGGKTFSGEAACK